jgi:hypothetical protein
MIDDDDPQQPRALDHVEYKRVVYVSCAEKGVGWKAVKPLHDRISNNSDPDTTLVSWLRDDMWIGGSGHLKLSEWLRNVTDFVLVLDDDVVEALREFKAEAEPGEMVAGLELVTVLRKNDDCANNAEQLVRIWVAKAAAVQLIGLKRIAGRAEWNLHRVDEQKRLHWLYEPDDVVFRGKLEKGVRPVGADDKRLGQRVGLFIEHELPKCRVCGAIHAPAAAPGP